ncbi:MAG: hypothetical protein JOZ02_19330 [Acidobacteria bacterium]|nr:hypothetical protein [Acidobacteriota bacterium]
MFCPNCGAAEQAVDSYCKRCGEWLPDMRRRRGRRIGNATPEQLLTRVLFLGGLSSVASLIATVLLFTVHTGGGPVEKAVMLAATFTLLACVWQFISSLIGFRLKRRLTSARTAGAERQGLAGPAGRRPELAAADTSRFADVRSVTEGTTELLEPLPRRGRDTGELR